MKVFCFHLLGIPMMKKHFDILLAWLVAFLMAPLAAEVLPVNGDFSEVTADGQPAGWVLHTWSGFQPLATMTVLPGADNGNNAVRIRDIRGQNGMGFRNEKHFPARSGDQVRVTFRVRGRGRAKGSVEIYHYTAKGEWNPPSEKQYFEYSPDWRTQVCSFYLSNGPRGETAAFQVCFGAMNGAEIELSSVRVEQIPAQYVGDVPFPTEWVVFGPVDSNFKPETGQLLTIPDNFAGLPPRSGQLHRSLLDFAPYVGGPGEKKCGWAFAVIESPIDCDYTIGAGGDWWMEYYLNGELIFDLTGPGGNVAAPVAPDNHLATVRLRKGRNILAVKLITGSKSSHLYTAGPLELRSSQGKVKLQRIDWLEDFDQRSLQVSGNPAIIQGYPTPGLLALTGQGVFQAGDDVLAVVPDQPRLALPKDSETYLASGVRIQNFGEEAKDGALAIVFADADASFAAAIVHHADSDLLSIQFEENGVPVSTDEVPVDLLPADFLLAANRVGDYFLLVDSLVDSSSRAIHGTSSFFANHPEVKLSWQLTPGSTVTVDNLLHGHAIPEDSVEEVPFRIDIDPAFNPDKAGWPVVFQDDFDGPELDTDKWEMSAYKCNPKLMHFEDGKLIIQADWNKDHTALEGVSLWSKPRFLYGYFEARVKFRKEHGWWSAFWLCVPNPSNAFVDGFEIDIYEDYYLRPLVPGGPPRDILDHNLHMFAGGGLKSWNYNSRLPGSIEDFYVVGCKWTPFEISYYLNGKLIDSTANHSPYHTVTFDAFHHGTCIKPLSAILSASLGRSGGDPKDGNFPDQFEVDYVKIWGYPQEEAPSVKVTSQGAEEFVLPEGRKVTFQVEAIPSEMTNAPITGVYLMDSGFLVDYKTEPPYEFTVSLTPKFYSTTNFVKPGRTGIPIPFGKGMHAFAVMVQDANGKVAYSNPDWHLISYDTGKTSTPYQGVAPDPPCRIKMSHYDEGGPDVAYFDTTPANQTDKTGTFRTGESVDCNEDVIGYVAPTEWLNYTIEVTHEGAYAVQLCYGTPNTQRLGVMLFVDGLLAGEFQLKAHEAKNWNPDTVAEITGIHLAKGQHTLKFFFLGGANFSHFDLVKE